MRFLVAFVAGIYLFYSTEAHAELVLRFGQGSTIGLGQLDAIAGQQIDLDVYVTQLGTFTPLEFPLAVGDFRLSNNPSTSTNDGLGSFVFDVSSTSNLVRNAGLDNLVLGNGFLLDPAIRNSQPVSGAMRVSAFATNDLASPNLTPIFASEAYQSTLNPNNGSVESNSIRLASIRLNIDPLAAGAQSITLSSPYNPSVPSQSLYYFGIGSNAINPASIVGPTSGSLVLNITAVPEPTSVALVGSIAFGVAALRIFRNRRKEAYNRP